LKKARRPARPEAVRSGAVEPLRDFLRDHWKLLLVVLAVFVLTADDRHVGIVPDGRQMIWTAVAMTETGQLGQARGRDFTIERAAGDSVSRYGMGMSLAQIPAALLAPAVERRFGAASSQPLFLLAPLFSTLLAAVFAGLAARQLAANRAAERAAILLTALGSPLAAYAAMEFSEPLQAAALAAAFALALLARERPRYAFAAGFAAGVAVLAKSVLLAVAPLALLPLLPLLLTARKRLVSAAIGAAPPLALWLIFELIRFGRPLAGYGGERFSHELLDGVWRLLVGPNKGFLWVFPALVVCVWVGVPRSSSGSSEFLGEQEQPHSVPPRGTPRNPEELRGTRLPIASALSTFIALLLIAAKWWAWHGAEGWGPRLLVPAVPLLAAVAAPLIATWRTPLQYAFIAISIAANALPLLQHPTPVATLVNSSTWPVADKDTAARVADYARLGSRVAPDGLLATIPAASPWLVYPWFIRTTWGAVTPRELAAPPWIQRRPDIRPEVEPLPAVFRVISPRQWRFLGRGLFPDELQPRYAAVYDEALLDQIARAHQLGRGNEALELARKLHSVAPGPDSAVMIMESYRVLGMQTAAQYYLADLPREWRADPRMNLIIALFERDKGNEESARRFLENAASSLPGTPAAAAVSRPMSEWPKSLAEMTAAPVEGAQ
jgi:hypothetical protein